MASKNSNNFDASIKYSTCTRTGPYLGFKSSAPCGNGQCIDGVKSRSLTAAVLYHFLAIMLVANAIDANDNVMGIPKKLATKPHSILPMAKPPYIMSKYIDIILAPIHLGVDLSPMT